MVENVDDRRKQLRFRSWHRGTREMDLLLGSFADLHVSKMSIAELDDFAVFLEIGDPQLYNWYMGKEKVPASLDTPLMSAYLKHKLA